MNQEFEEKGDTSFDLDDFFGAKPKHNDKDKTPFVLETQSSTGASMSDRMSDFAEPTSSERREKLRNLEMGKNLNRDGVISMEDRWVVKKMILDEDPQISGALELAIQGDRLALDALIAQTKVDYEDNKRREVATEQFKLRNSFRSLHNNTFSQSYKSNFENSSLASNASFRRSFSELVAEAAPHPAAGGFRGRLPKTMHMLNGKLMGHVLVRVTSKKLFRKWKIVFFELTKASLNLYETMYQWEGHQDPLMSIPLTPTMFVCKASLKTSQSAMDIDGREIYFTTLRNKDDFSAGRICKLAAQKKEDITALAYAIHGVIREQNRTGWNR